jgi:phage gp29-like protein
MFGDDRVMAVSDTRSDALLGLPFELQPRGDGRTGPRVASSLASVWEVAYPEAELKKLHQWGVGLGIGLARNAWAYDDDGLLVPHLEVWSPRWLSWDWDQNVWMVEVSQGGAATEKIPIVPGDGEWILYTPHGISRPWIYGAYRALARWCLLKEYARLDWGGYSERLGQGVWVTETEKDSGAGLGTSTQRDELVSDLQGIGRNTAIALNPGEHLKLIESVARSQDNFKLQIDTADNGIAVSWLGQNLTTQAGTGTMGAASLHGRVLHGRTRMDGKTLPMCLRAQSTCFFAEYNYGNRANGPAPWWDTLSIDDAAAKAAVRQMDAQADATLVGAGIETPNEARKRNGLAPIEGGDQLRIGPVPNATPAAAVSVASPSQSSVDAMPAPENDANAAAAE